MTNLFDNKFRIPSARATWHSYNGGVYFVTLCTKDKRKCLVVIVDKPESSSSDDSVQNRLSTFWQPEMILSEAGIIVERHIKEISIHCSYVEVPLYVVMPNHLHLIIMINGEEASCNRNLLSQVLRGFKSGVTREMRMKNIAFEWQSRFYDRIVRNHDELDAIGVYIRNTLQNGNLTKRISNQNTRNFTIFVAAISKRLCHQQNMTCVSQTKMPSTE